MTLGSDPIKTEYQYIWTPFGLIKKPAEQEPIKIPFAQQEVKTGDASRLFPFLQTPPTPTESKPNTVFPTNTATSNTYTTTPETKMAEADAQAQAKMAKADAKAQAKMTEAEDKFNKTSKVAEDKFVKTGESVDERLSRYYSKYKDATPEEKEKLLDKYITQSYSAMKGKSKEEQIQIQLADYKKLLYNTREGNSYEMMAKRINILEKDNQIEAAKAATLEQQDLELRKRGEIGVAKTIQNCDKGNQIELTQLVVDSKNAEAINIGASHASELNKTNQVGAVDIYKTADIPKEAKMELGKTIIDQYAKFDVANQVEIHKTMSDKDYWDKKTIVYAASNIYQMDKTNQAQGVQVTFNTKIEEAANAAAANYSKYDTSARAEIKTIINNSDCESAKETLSKAEQETKEAEQEQESKETEEEAVDKKSNSSDSKSDKVDKTNQITKAIQSKDPNAIENVRNLIKNVPDNIKMNLLTTLQGNDLKNFIIILIQENPSMDVLSKAMELSTKLSPEDQKDIMGSMKNTSLIKLISPETLGYTAQVNFLNLNKDNLGIIKENKLCSVLREKYFKLKKEKYTDNGKQVG